MIASVTGTDADPQGRAAQIRKLANAGIIVAESNAEAAQMAVTALAGAQAAGLPRAAVSSPGRQE
jgi:FdrA protein